MEKNLSVLFVFLISSSLAWGNGISATRQQEILHVLKHDCGSCHGMTLKGGLGPSLRADVLKRMTEEQVALTITLGRPGTPMPPWKPFFNEQETRWLAQQLLAGVNLNETNNNDGKEK